MTIESHIDALQMERHSILGSDPLAGKPCETCEKYALDCGADCEEPTSEDSKLEHAVMVHRYLYYIECAPMISDHEYDALERAARAALPDGSPVHKLGSSLVSDYSEAVITDALWRLK